MTDPAPAQQIREALHTAPILLAEIRANLTPSRTSDGTPGAPGHHRSAPLALHAVDDADDIYAALVEHAEAIAGVLGMTPPAAPVNRSSTGRPLGLTAGTTAAEAKWVATILSRFIEHHLTYLTDDPELIQDISNDIITRIHRADRNYPRTAKPEQIPARCTLCEVLDVYKHPPRNVGDPERYECRSCDHTLTETEAMRQCEAREKELRARRGKGGAE